MSYRTTPFKLRRRGFRMVLMTWRATPARPYMEGLGPKKIEDFGEQVLAIVTCHGAAAAGPPSKLSPPKPQRAFAMMETSIPAGGAHSMPKLLNSHATSTTPSPTPHAFLLARAAMSAALMEELTRWRKSEAARLEKPAYVGGKRDHDRHSPTFTWLAWRHLTHDERHRGV